METAGIILSISYSVFCDVTNDLEYAKPASRRFPIAFSFMISGRRIKRGLVGVPVKDISLSAGRGKTRREGGQPILGPQRRLIDLYHGAPGFTATI